MADEHDEYKLEPIDLEALARERERREADELVDVALEYAGGAFLLFRSRDDTWDSISVPNVDGAGVESTVDFTARVDRADAQRLGDFFRRVGVFVGTEPKGCALSRRPDGFVVSVFIPEGYLDDRDVIREFDSLRRQLSAEVFNGQPVILQMCKRDVIVAGNRRHLNVVRELRD